MTESQTTESPQSSLSEKSLNKKRVAILGSVAVIIAIAAAAFFYKKSHSTSPADSSPAVTNPPPCDGFKILQASGWFCIPKSGKSYRISGPDSAIKGEKPIPNRK